MSEVSASTPVSDDDYDEFGFLEEVAAEWTIPWKGRPAVARHELQLASGQSLSYLSWGEASPEIVFLHGGGQNAHTWDAVALALRRPAIAFDLPGHGRSSWREDRDYSPWKNADALASALPRLAPDAQAIVGMSLGGITTIRLAGICPDLMKKVVIVDVTPQAGDPSRRWTREQRGTVALIGEAQTYETFEAMAEAAIALSPRRSSESVRRGVRHNSKRLPDGRWRWRYDLGRDRPRPPSDFVELWDDVSRIQATMMLIVGGESAFVRDADISEMRRRQPNLRVEKISGAGHAVQSDKPLELVRLIKDFVYGQVE